MSKKNDKYCLTIDEVQLLVIGALYPSTFSGEDFSITTLDIKEYLRRERNANITQKVVSEALDEFFLINEEENLIWSFGGIDYVLARKLNQDTVNHYWEYYLDRCDANTVNITDSAEDVSDEDIIRMFVERNIKLSSKEIADKLNDLDILDYKVSQQSITAYKANITRKGKY